MRLDSKERYRFSNGEEMLSDATSNARILDLVRGEKKRRGERDGGGREEMGGERERERKCKGITSGRTNSQSLKLT